jgi:hypothetical protein
MKQASLPLENLQAWAHFNDIQLSGTSVEPHILAADGTDKGGGLLATTNHAPTEPLLSVPLSLVLSKERVEQCAKEDKDLRTLIDAVPSLFQVRSCRPTFARSPTGRSYLMVLTLNHRQTPRTAVLLFLIYEMTVNCPDAQTDGLGFKNPFADYVKFLPKQIPLPTFYTSEERELLVGTSLSEALDQKMLSLEREFDTLKQATAMVPWCQRVWWHQEEGCLELADWKLADAIYRSRALELPRGASVGMVPVVDMANHACDDRYNARFEVDDDDGRVLLVTRDNCTIHQGDEVTIMYGVGGACEMIFSYGFIEEHVTSARELFLSLTVPSDDPLRLAKLRFAQEAPGVRLYVDQADQVRWESTFVWWSCINEEDGLDFKVEQSVNGDMELMALWHSMELTSGELQSTLLQHPLRDIFVLRAVVMIQQRVEEQGSRLVQSEEDFESTLVNNGQVRQSVHETIGRLRKLEMDLLGRAYESLEKEVSCSLCIRHQQEFAM